MIIVAKVGTSSITDDDGTISVPAIEKFCAEVVELRAADGKGMRYAISAADGSIRQRSVFQ